MHYTTYNFIQVGKWKIPFSSKTNLQIIYVHGTAGNKLISCFVITHKFIATISIRYILVFLTSSTQCNNNSNKNNNTLSSSLSFVVFVINHGVAYSSNTFRAALRILGILFFLDNPQLLYYDDSHVIAVAASSGFRFNERQPGQHHTQRQRQPIQ